MRRRVALLAMKLFNSTDKVGLQHTLCGPTGHEILFNSTDKVGLQHTLCGPTLVDETRFTQFGRKQLQLLQL